MLPLASGEAGAPFLDTSKLYSLSRWLWTDTRTGGVFPTTTTSAPFWLSLKALADLGVEPWLVQAGTYLLLIAAAGLSVNSLVQSTDWPHRRPVGVLAAVFYMAGPVAMVNVYNRFLLTHLIFQAWLPLALVLMRKAYGRGRFFWILVFCLLQVWFAHAFGTPGFVLILWTLLSLDCLRLVLIEKRPQILTTFGLAVGAWMTTNLWWLIPLLRLGPSIYAPVASRESNTDSFIGVSEYMSLPYVLRGVTSYLFKASNFFEPIYSSDWFLSIGFGLPIATILAVLIYRRDIDVLSLMMIALLSIFIMKGASGPGGGVFLRLLEDLRPLQLLRNPYERSSFMFALASSILAAVSIVWLVNRTKGLIRILGYLLLSSILAFSWPVFSGNVFFNHTFGTTELAVPKDYRQVREWLADHPDAQGLPPRTLVAPVAGEGVSQIWPSGYRGVDLGAMLIPGSISFVSAIPLPQTLQDEIRQFPLREPASILRALAVQYVVVREDILTGPDGLLDPDLVKRIANRMPELQKKVQFGALGVYEVRDHCSKGQISVATDVTMTPVASFSELPKSDIGCTTNIASAAKPRSEETTAVEIKSVRKVNPALYRTVIRSNGPYWIVLAQSSDPGWQAFVDTGSPRCRQESSILCISREASRSMPLPVKGTASAFASAWYVPRGGTSNITLYFAPQELLDRGALFSVVGLLVLAIAALYEGWASRKSILPEALDDRNGS